MQSPGIVKMHNMYVTHTNINVCQTHEKAIIGMH